MAGINHKIIRPQPGYQEAILSSPADIAIGGGAAGCGKTFSLLLEPLRHINNPGFGAVIFRRTSPQISNEGALWDTSESLYPFVGAKAVETKKKWDFPSGCTIKFNHLQLERDKFAWQGSSIPFLGFDEVTHFTKSQFLYLLSRNRSTCGVRPYVRATCNPDPDSWVANFIEWWIDQESGYPIPERAGVLRYFTQDNGNIVWGDSAEEVYEMCRHIYGEDLKNFEKSDLIKSMTFIPGSIYENKALLNTDPGYLGNLLSQDEATKLSLLEGNWKRRDDGKSLYNYTKLLDLPSNSFQVYGSRYISADVAMEGSDRFVIWIWDNRTIIDLIVIEKSNGKEVETAIKDAAHKYKVPQSNIVYDSDGLGKFLKGYLPSAVPFINNGVPIKVTGIKENYFNAKTQCYYNSAKRVNDNETYIKPEVAFRMYNGKRVIDWLTEELYAHKKDNKDNDGKLRIVSKEQVKNAIGRSPDFADAFMMREWLDLREHGRTVQSFSKVN